MLILKPHFFSCRLRYLNRRIWLKQVLYPTPSESMGRLRVTAGKIRNAADAARLLSQHSTAAQANLFSIAVDKNGNIVEVHRYGIF